MPKATHIKLDKYEQEIADNIEKAEHYSSEEVVRLKKLSTQAAKNYFRRKVERINVGVFVDDLKTIKEKAYEEGLPYQTFLTSLIHKFAAGKLKELPRH